jgi:5'-deoxynucleotidase YfbR-like HD superfamily hydrolase
MSVLEGWQAARVVRKHTLPHIRQENIAEHTWGVLHILLSIYPNAPAIIVKGALYHDLGEHKSGDIPGDFKADNPEIRGHTERYELEAAKRVVPESMHNCLSLLPSELCLVKFCDKLEFAFSCYHEWMLGNRYSIAPMERTVEMARKAIPDAIFVELPEHVRHGINDVLAEAQRLLEQMR